MIFWRRASIYSGNKTTYVGGNASNVLRPWFQVWYDRRNSTVAQCSRSCEMELKYTYVRYSLSRSLKVLEAPISLLYITCALI